MFVYDCYLPTHNRNAESAIANQTYKLEYIAMLLLAEGMRHCIYSDKKNSELAMIFKVT